MDQQLIINFLLCLLCSVATFYCTLNLCSYFHVDEKDVVNRLIAVKNRDIRSGNPRGEFALTSNNFHFKFLSALFSNVKVADRITALLNRADIPWQVDTFLIMSMVLGSIPLLISLFTSPFVALLGILFFFIPLLHVHLQIKKRTLSFTQQLPDALDLLCNALRAGHSLFAAFDIIVREMPSPINKIFKVLTDEIAMGIDTKDAMRSLQEMVPESVDLRFFTTVVILQREIGGNLIKLLEILAKTIRERFKMIGQLKAQTMQAKLSGVIVSVIPPIIAVVLFCMAPEYMNYLVNHTYGKIALGASIVLMIAGFFIIKKITDIEV